MINKKIIKKGEKDKREQVGRSIQRCFLLFLMRYPDTNTNLYLFTWQLPAAKLIVVVVFVMNVCFFEETRWGQK
jgi:hypothetical protein